MLTKVQFIVQIKGPMFSKLYLLNRVIVNLLHLLVEIRIESNFPLINPSKLMSLFKLVVDKFILSTTEKSETSSAKSQVKRKINKIKEKKQFYKDNAIYLNRLFPYQLFA